MSVSIFAGTIGTQAGGMETYEITLLRELAQQDSSTRYRVYCLNQAAKDILDISQENFEFRLLYPSSRWISVGLTLPLMLNFDNNELFHPTYIPPATCPKPFVYTVHSSVTWAHPEFYPQKILWRLNKLQEKGLKQARLLLCVSKHVRDYLSEKFKIPDERLAVVYHGVSDRFRPREKTEYVDIISNKYGLNTNYFLCVGKLKTNKNISRIIESHELLWNQGHEIPLVFVGRRLWSQGQLDNEIDRAVAAKRVIELGHVDLTDMPLIYNGATALIFPSQWEGFGLPILEAQASAIPVLTSNNSSLPEIAGNNAVLVDPSSIEEIAQGMHTLLMDQQLRARLIAGGLKNASAYTWERTARQTIDAYYQVLSH